MAASPFLLLHTQTPRLSYARHHSLKRGWSFKVGTESTLEGIDSNSKLGPLMADNETARFAITPSVCQKINPSIALDLVVCSVTSRWVRNRERLMEKYGASPILLRGRGDQQEGRIRTDARRWNRQWWCDPLLLVRADRNHLTLVSPRG